MTIPANGFQCWHIPGADGGRPVKDQIGLAAIPGPSAEGLLMNGDHAPSPAGAHRCSWLRTGRLIIGAWPRGESHWQSLAGQGVRSVFSCCDPQEGPWQPPAGWQQARITLPDHRNPGAMDPAALDQAITTALQLYRQAPALYLHCWAGMERSPLVAVGLLCRAESLSIFDALAQVRTLHPPSRPITRHLVMLEDLLGR